MSGNRVPTEASARHVSDLSDRVLCEAGVMVRFAAGLDDAQRSIGMTTILTRRHPFQVLNAIVGSMTVAMVGLVCGCRWLASKRLQDDSTDAQNTMIARASTELDMSISTLKDVFGQDVADVRAVCGRHAPYSTLCRCIVNAFPAWNSSPLLHGLSIPRVISDGVLFQ